jgi:hypothetical protein
MSKTLEEIVLFANFECKCAKKPYILKLSTKSKLIAKIIILPYTVNYGLFSANTVSWHMRYQILLQLLAQIQPQRGT